MKAIEIDNLSKILMFVWWQWIHPRGWFQLHLGNHVYQNFKPSRVLFGQLKHLCIDTMHPWLQCLIYIWNLIQGSYKFTSIHPSIHPSIHRPAQYGFWRKKKCLLGGFRNLNPRYLDKLIKIKRNQLNIIESAKALPFVSRIKVPCFRKKAHILTPIKILRYR